MTAPRRVILAGLVLLALLAGCARGMPGAAPRFRFDARAPSAPPARPTLRLEDDDRILVVAPHPDDEVLATGGLIQQAMARGLPVKVVFLTNGDNNEFTYFFFSKAFTLDAKSAVYAGQTRAFEALRAGRDLGLDVSQETFLGYPDFGTLEIWQNRWGDDREAFRSMFSEQNSVPYWFARTPNAPYKGESILADLSAVLKDFKPTKIFVSHPGDGNPDHAALPLYLSTALWDLGLQPQIYFFLTHYGAWPLPRGLHPEATLEPPAQFDDAGRWVSLPLEPGQTRAKLNALTQHKTQFEANARFLESYMRANEVFDRLEPVALDAAGPGMTLLPSGKAVPAGQPLPDSPAVGLPRTVRLDRGDLVISYNSAGPARIQIMGWRPDRPFATMPKLDVDVTASGETVTERRKPLPAGAVGVNRGEAMTEVRVPLALLGDPQRLRFNAALAPDDGPRDPMPWVEIDLP